MGLGFVVAAFSFFFAHKKADSSFGLVCIFFSRQKSNVESEKRRAEKLERDMAIAAEKADKAHREVRFFLKTPEFSLLSCFENLSLGRNLFEIRHIPLNVRSMYAKY